MPSGGCGGSARAVVAPGRVQRTLHRRVLLVAHSASNCAGPAGRVFFNACKPKHHIGEAATLGEMVRTPLCQYRHTHLPLSSRVRAQVLPESNAYSKTKA